MAELSFCHKMAEEEERYAMEIEARAL